MSNSERPERSDAMKHPTDTNLILGLEQGAIPSFFQLLQHGVIMKAQVRCTVKDFLCHQLGISREYVGERIQTIFLNGKAVDDADSAVLNDGSRLALSASMPGLAGATLRKGGFFGSMRNQISHDEHMKPEPLQEGMIFLKLFNLIAKELGPMLLKRGVWITGDRLEDFFRKQSDSFWARCKMASKNGEHIVPNELAGLQWSEKQVFLQLQDL